MKLRINVTKKILRRSWMCGADVGEGCAIALAVLEIFPYAWTSRTEITVYKGPRIFVQDELRDVVGRIQMPIEATAFTYAFDNLKGRALERLTLPELSFDVVVPQSIIDHIGIAEIERILATSSNLEMA